MHIGLFVLFVDLFIQFEHHFFSQFGYSFLMFEVHLENVFLELIDLSPKSVVFDVQLLEFNLQLVVFDQNRMESKDEGSQYLSESIEVIVLLVVENGGLVRILVFGLTVFQQFCVFFLAKLEIFL
jgi:hypothetical protein